MTITDEQMDMIVSEGIAFIRSITNAYGSEEGMKLWETIADTLDPDIKGKIFFAMLVGTHDDRVTMSRIGNGANKITCIKYIRQYTGYGLVEAKNAYENVAFGQSVTLKVDPKQRRAFINDLIANGMIAS